MDGLVSLGTGGAAVVATFTLFVGVRGKNKIDIKDEHVPYWAYGIGLLAANAGTSFHGIGEAGHRIDAAFQQAQNLGEWKTGATAAVLTIAVFGLKARPWKDSILGAIAPSTFLAAGGLWTLLVQLPTTLILALVGA